MYNMYLDSLQDSKSHLCQWITSESLGLSESRAGGWLAQLLRPFGMPRHCLSTSYSSQWWCSYTTDRILASQDGQKGKGSWYIAQVCAPMKILGFRSSKIGSGALFEVQSTFLSYINCTLMSQFYCNWQTLGEREEAWMFVGKLPSPIFMPFRATNCKESQLRKA